ncbi:MAG TPA: ATP-dependent DNA helicase RecG, partial [bacterium]|nr:ATP-dependent DNA helicase RecG [bacterium]
YLPEELLDRYRLMRLQEAISAIHEPRSAQEIDASRRRFAFDELFMIAATSNMVRGELSEAHAPRIDIDLEYLKRLKLKLPFKLTEDQEKALADITNDISGTTPSNSPLDKGENRPMSRLLNGDVGSGKTIVACLAAASAARAGFRTLIMAPTEILAKQHFKTFCEVLKNEDVSIGLITSSTKMVVGKPKTQIPEQKENPGLKPENAQFIVGTHALLTKGRRYDRVGLVVVDEQHRFGVEQRSALKRVVIINDQLPIINQFKNSKIDQLNVNCKLKIDKLEKRSPHFLSMTATPIPRTLQLALFGDLDVSLIKEKPSNRKAIKTRFVEPHNREKAYQFIKAQVSSGRQVFVVCPLIQENMEQETWNKSQELFETERKSVMSEYEKLKKEIFPEFKVVMLHGKMKSKEKDEIMLDFSRGKTNILVSTSVIEVGVDVPNATVMMIEDAERFGLAQIHQFRGRVGRGEHQSFCFLFSNSVSEKAMQRLRGLESTDDGFALAELDLSQRGPGSILGTMQSGITELQMASFSDLELVSEASEAAGRIVAESPDLENFPLLKEKIMAFRTGKHLE